MPTIYESIQSYARSLSGKSYDYNGDLHALFDSANIPSGSFNERYLAYINQILEASYKEINGAINAFVKFIANGAQSTNKILIAHGDSITSSLQPSADITKNWSIQLQSLISARQGTSYTLTQKGLSGYSWNYVLSGAGPNTINQDAVINIDPLASASAILIAFAGTNGLWLQGNTPAVEAAGADAYIAARISAGFTASNIYIMGMLPREQYKENLRKQYNDLLAGYCTARGCKFIAIQDNFDIGWPSQQNNTTWFQADQVHPSPLGHTQIAELVYDALFADAWTPSLIASRASAPLALWFDPTDTTTTFADVAGTTPATTSVALWKDKSGNNRNASQATAGNQPTLTTINGTRALACLNTGPQFLAATGLSGMPGSAMTFAAVANISTGNAIPYDSSSDGVNSDLFALRGQGAGFQLANVSGAPSFPSNTTLAASVIVASPNGQALINGARQVSLTGTAPATTPTAIRIGRGFNNGFSQNNPIGEEILFAGTLTHVFQARLDRYLRSKYGIGTTRANAVSFTDVTGAATSTLVTSNTVTISGLASTAQMRVWVNGTTTPQFSVNGGAFSNSPTMVSNGDTIQIRQTTGATSATEYLAELQIGDQRYYLSVKT